MIWITLGVIGWLYLGWFGGCIMRHHFIAEFGGSLGEEAWDSGDEWMARAFMLTGPLFLLIALIINHSYLPVRRSWFR